MLQYDLNFVSDYVINKLEKYVSMADFTIESIAAASRAASLIAGWIIAIYNFSSKKMNVSLYFRH